MAHTVKLEQTQQFCCRCLITSDSCSLNIRMSIPDCNGNKVFLFPDGKQRCDKERREPNEKLA